MGHCCVCGRFCAYGDDSSIPFGSYNDLEPPDPEFYCRKCAAEQEDYYVSQGWVPNDWVKAKWQRRAAERLGLEEITPSKGVAWTVWRNKWET